MSKFCITKTTTTLELQQYLDLIFKNNQAQIHVTPYHTFPNSNDLDEEGFWKTFWEK